MQWHGNKMLHLCLINHTLVSTSLKLLDVACVDSLNADQMR